MTIQRLQFESKNQLKSKGKQRNFLSKGDISTKN